MGVTTKAKGKVKCGYDHLCSREENFWVNNNYSTCDCKFCKKIYLLNYVNAETLTT